MAGKTGIVKSGVEQNPKARAQTAREERDGTEGGEGARPPPAQLVIFSMQKACVSGRVGEERIEGIAACDPRTGAWYLAAGERKLLRGLDVMHMALDEDVRGSCSSGFGYRKAVRWMISLVRFGEARPKLREGVCDRGVLVQESFLRTAEFTGFAQWRGG
ncbi:hypothetical protein MMC32_002713 [Xylographa parallela]|nr:hypothetical protein [Xylographa parallela]